MTTERKKIPVGLLLIGIMKLATAGLLAAMALGVFKLLNRDIGETLEQAVTMLHLDPKRHLITEALSKVSGLSHHQLKEIGAGTLFYALLYAIEGMGLLMGKHWAEYLVIIITGSLLPLEIYEIIEKMALIRIGVMALNIVILIYLVLQLRRDKKPNNL